MKTLELRRGNWVSCRSKNSQVETIKEFFITTTTGYGILIDVDKIFPIPLTEQWAKDFGFELNENRTLFGKCIQKEGALFTCNVMFTAKGYWIIIHRSEGGTTKKMNIGHYNFVHQIQNLWFALTGEELTLKP